MVVEIARTNQLLKRVFLTQFKFGSFAKQSGEIE
jgi:hypothetical protein